MAYSRDQIYQAMRAADAAGDGDSVRALAAQLDQPQADAPMSDDQFKAGLHALLAAPKLDRQAVTDYITQHGKSINDPSIGAALDWAQAHPGHGGEIGVNINRNGPALAAPNNAGMSAVMGAGRGYTAGFLDKIGAGLDAVAPSFMGAWDGPGIQNIWNGHSFSDAYNNNLSRIQGQADADAAANPVATGLGQIAGAIASPVNKIAAPVEGGNVLANVGRIAGGGALYGGAYGYSQSRAPDTTGQLEDAGWGGLAGAGTNLAGAGAGKVVGAAVRGVTDPVKLALSDAGVSMTPGQLAGGWLAGAERKMTSEPIGGPAISQRLGDSADSWWKTTINRALAPLGKTLPEGTSADEALGVAKGTIDNAYSTARSGMAFSPDPQFEQGLADLTDRIHNGGADSLAPEYRQQFSDVVENTLNRRLGPDGMMNGDALKATLASIGRKADGLMAGNNTADARDYGMALKELSGLVDDAAMRNPNTSPEAAKLMNDANQGFQLYALARQAAKKGATDEVGTATPFQYLQAVKGADKSVDKQAFSTKNAFDQPYAMGSVATLGKDLPNSFTADRSGMMHLIGTLGAAGGADAGLTMAGHSTAGMAAAGLATIPGIANRALYTRPVNSFIQNVATGGGAGRRIAGQAISDAAPAIGNAFTGSVSQQVANHMNASRLAVQNQLHP
jgi:hypothetical protein